MRGRMIGRSLNSIVAKSGVRLNFKNRRRMRLALSIRFRHQLIVASFLCLYGSPLTCAANLKNNDISTQTSSSRRAIETANVVQLLCQMTLDLPALEKYLHPTEPKRKPLRVVKNDTVKGDIKLTKFNLPVEFITLTEAKKQKIPHFEFTSIVVNDNTATVSFLYRVEGVRGQVSFKREGAWQVVSHELVEE